MRTCLVLATLVVGLPAAEFEGSELCETSPLSKSSIASESGISGSESRLTQPRSSGGFSYSVGGRDRGPRRPRPTYSLLGHSLTHELRAPLRC